jgi:hypothetical protein
MFASQSLSTIGSEKHTAGALSLIFAVLSHRRFSVIVEDTLKARYKAAKIIGNHGKS